VGSRISNSVHHILSPIAGTCGRGLPFHLTGSDSGFRIEIDWSFVCCHSLQALLENLDDASNELILTDEDQVRVKVGDVVFHTEKDDVDAVIERETDATRAELERLEEESSETVRKMGELKDRLYGKFGRDSINLEED
jgi:chaperonin cofactor prefoldin